MSDAPARPRGMREGIVHAAVVATAWMLGELVVVAVFSLKLGLPWHTAGATLLVSSLRRSFLVGIAAAVAAHRRPLCSRPRAALECALVALLHTYVGFALALGSAVSEEVTGVAVVGGGAPIAVEQAIERFVVFLVSPWTYLRVAGLAVGLYLAASRRGTRWEGLALRGPVAVTAFNSGLSLFAIPVVAIALPMLTRVADRLFAHRERER